MRAGEAAFLKADDAAILAIFVEVHPVMVPANLWNQMSFFRAYF